MTTVFDRLVACAPVNKQAALSVASGVTMIQGTPTKVGNVLHWTAPPKLRSVPPLMPDHTGRSYGRVRVVGLIADTEGGKARWLVRCDCGDYEPRSSKAVSRADPGEMCALCRQTTYLQHRARSIQYGNKVANGIQEEERNRLLEVDAARKAAFARNPVSRPTGAATSVPAALISALPVELKKSPRHVAFVIHDSMRASIRELVATGIKGIDLANRMQERYPLGRDLATHLLRGLVDAGEIVEIELYVPDGLRKDGAYVGSFYLPAGGRFVQAV